MVFVLGIFMPKENLLNQRFGRLVVVEELPKQKRNPFWKCKCDCGNYSCCTSGNLKSGKIVSCGCLKLEKLLQRSTTHNQRHTHLYEVWKGIRQRCKNPKRKGYHNYGGRGITICEEWDKSFQAFYDWSYANGYSTENQKNEKLKLTIDRIDNNGNYEPSNCRWVDRKTQASNMRTTKLITINGETKCLAEWFRNYNISSWTYYTRIKYGWTIEEALTKPIGSKKSK